MHLRLNEQLYVKFQFYTAHYIADYSSMLCTLCTHKLHILALSLTSDCIPGLVDRAVYNTICCNYAIRSYANCGHLWLPCGTSCWYKCAHNVTGNKSCSHACISGELIVSKYVAESITMIAGRFGHEGLCQLRTELFDVQNDIMPVYVPAAFYNIICIV